MFLEKRLLCPHLLETMLKDELHADYGMGIEVEGTIIGHSGSDLGFSADVRMDLKTGDIALIFTAEGNANTDWSWEALE